jgi:formate/nitrite transporter FocA (FNT family)
MMPSCKGQETFTIIILIYLIALGEFTHVVAGSVEIFLVIFEGGISVLDGLLLLFATAFGNIIGGTGLFALLVYAQIREEI